MFELRAWEIKSIIKGYRRRNRDAWDMARMIGFTVAKCFGAKFRKFSDYIEYPWDKVNMAKARKLNEDEVCELLNEIKRENEKLKVHQTC